MLTDAKSYGSTKPHKITKPRANLPKQARYLTDLVNKISKSDLQKNSIADALAHGRYLMVFINSNENIQTLGVGSHCLTLGGNDVKSFLSFFYTFYRLFRMASVKNLNMNTKDTKDETND